LQQTVNKSQPSHDFLQNSLINQKNMVNVMKGVLIECDPAMKQFLLHLDEKVSKQPIT